jgi:four helix bundle protein
LSVVSGQWSVLEFGVRRGKVVAYFCGIMRKYDYTELVAWQLAMDLAVAVYEVSQALPADERFGLTAQMRRAAVSIPANIAEGQGRRTCGEFLNQLSVAYGSLCELETHILLAQRLGMMEEEAGKGILGRAAEVGRLVNGLTSSLRTRRSDN